jgi:hypothetical protein
LTLAGQERALRFLGIQSPPPRCDWKTIQSKFLTPLALGLDPATAEAKRVSKEDGLAAWLLKRRFHLSEDTNTISQALLAVLCQQLGLADVKNSNELRNALLRKRIGAEGKVSGTDLNKLAVRLLLDTPRSGTDGLRDRLFRQWTDRELTVSESSNEPPAEFDLPAFAHTVRAASRRCSTGRFGDNKLFISHVWRQLRDEPSFRGMDRETFKQRLVEANRANLLTLSRADLVSVMNPEDVRASETHYLNAIFHFILLDEVAS